MKLLSAFRVVGLLGLTLLPVSAWAESQQVLLQGDVGSAFGHFSAPRTRSLAIRSRAFHSLDPIRFTVELPEAGQAQVELQRVVQRYWPAYYVSDFGLTADQSEVTLFRGVAHFGEQQVPLAAAIYVRDGSPVLFIDFTSPSGTSYHHLEVPIVSGSVSVAAALETTRNEELGEMACDLNHEQAAHSEHAHREHAVSSQNSVRSADVGTRALRVLEIATEADFEYFSRYGSSSNSRIASLINAADTIYQRDLNVDLQITTQHTVTTSSQPYTATASGSLLTQFVNYTNTNSQLGDADVYHLFSGKDFDSSVIGTAYLSVVCSVPSLSYGINQDIGNLTYLVFAHELGHNLGGNHDTSGSVSIMGPSLSSSSTGFSAFSIGEISEYVNDYGSCLAAGGAPSGGGGGDGGGDTPPPSDPSDASVSLSANFNSSTNVFSATVSADGADASDCRATLSMSSDITMAGAMSLAWGRSGSSTIVGSGKNKKRISVDSAALYVQAGYSCPSLGVSVSSDVQSIQVGNAVAAKRVTTAAKWIKSTLKAAAKSAKKRGNNS